jgi:hypothetical protein
VTGLINGDYLAVVSYAANGTTYNGIFLEHVRLGDTYVTGPVALNATVALNSTVALAANTATPADVAAVNPNSSSVVLAIQSAIAALPNTLATQASIDVLNALLNDVHDYSFGTWSVNKTVNPRVLTCYRDDGSVLATFRRGLSVLRAPKHLARAHGTPALSRIRFPSSLPVPRSACRPLRSPSAARNRPETTLSRARSDPPERGINFPVFDPLRKGVSLSNVYDTEEPGEGISPT